MLSQQTLAGFQAELKKLLHPMLVWLGDEPIRAISIQVLPTVEVQLVADEAEWFEYDKVPFSNLVARKRYGLRRDEVHQKLKDCFLNNPEARHVARIAKALFIPVVEDLEKIPWSLLLTEMVYREWIQRKKENDENATKRDLFGGVDLLRCLLRDIGSYGHHPQGSSVGMASRWAANAMGRNGPVVEDALGRWRHVTTEIGDKRLRKKHQDISIWSNMNCQDFEPNVHLLVQQQSSYHHFPAKMYT